MSYYTPSIEEFYVGFEYEQMFKIEESIIPEEVGQPMWVRQTCKKDDFNKVTNPIMTKYLRVKHLDKSDIVSLGWVEKENTKHCYNYLNWSLCITGEGILISLDGADSNEMEFFVKNKSELSKIMKFLNIKLTK